jgi:hypothetical protein
MASIESKSFMKYFFFMFVFIVSFILINTRTLEIFGLLLFFAINILFFLLIGKDLFDGSISSDGKNNEWILKYGIVLVSMAFSFVSSIMMIMTIVTLQNKFAENNSSIRWSPFDRNNLDTAEIIFITVTTFIGATVLYVYNTPEDVRKMTYTIFDTILNSSAANWLRVIFPIVTIGLGSALYGRLQMPPLEVNKFPNRVVCDPANDPGLQQFKDSFIKSFWFLFAFLVVVLARPFIEANFGISGLSPSAPFGFEPGDRSFVFGQNPSISILSILTLGFSNLMGMNKRMSYELSKEPESLKKSGTVGAIKSSIFASMLTYIILIIFMITKDKVATIIFSSVTVISIIAVIILLLIPTEMNPLNAETGIGKSVTFALKSILLMPILRWDVIYLCAKYVFGFLGLLYAGFSIRDFDLIPKNDPCLFRDAHIKQLYIAFIVFLIILYSFNTLSASNITFAITNVMRYLVPPALLGLSSYLVFITDYFLKMAPKSIVQ